MTPEDDERYGRLQRFRLAHPHLCFAPAACGRHDDVPDRDAGSRLSDTHFTLDGRLRVVPMAQRQVHFYKSSALSAFADEHSDDDLSTPSHGFDPELSELPIRCHRISVPHDAFVRHSPAQHSFLFRPSADAPSLSIRAHCDPRRPECRVLVRRTPESASIHQHLSAYHAHTSTQP